eukprot:m.81127 g.81127  ORF g.81127 m.81127 type:complete len:289 (-) comp25387_c0_seq1:152-1018(-)
MKSNEQLPFGGSSRNMPPKMLTVLLPIAILLTFMSVRIIPPANIGIKATFGHVSETTLESGIHITNPFANVHLFATKTLLYEQANHVPTSEGLTVDLDVAILYHIDVSGVRDIFLSLGLAYETVVIKPELSSAVRGLTSGYEAKALYTSGRKELQEKLKADLSAALGPRSLIVEDVLLRAVKLPAQLTHSIELKAQAEQDSQRMEFVLSKEKQEADRKAIEAKGISQFQKIVSEGISPALLQWKGIEATEKLAMSQNSKIVIMGNSKSDLPVILGGDYSDPPPAIKQP